MIRIHGLTNCDACRKARKAFADRGIDVEFRDIREHPMTPDQIAVAWREVGDRLLNSRSTTWRGLLPDERGLDPVELVSEYPALMKRPLIHGKVTTVGWDTTIEKLHLG